LLIGEISGCRYAAVLGRVVSRSVVKLRGLLHHLLPTCPRGTNRAAGSEKTPTFSGEREKTAENCVQDAWEENKHRECVNTEIGPGDSGGSPAVNHERIDATRTARRRGQSLSLL
jgi:hypothetical protein